MNWIERLFSKPPEKKTVTSEAQIAQVINSPFYNKWKTEYKPLEFGPMLNAYKSWIYVCSSKNAISVASVPLRLYLATKNGNTKKKIVETKKIANETKDYLFCHPGLVKTLSQVREVEEVVDHQLITLLKNINPYSNRFDHFELTELHQELTGNAYWVLVKDTETGLPNEIYILPPNCMRIVLGKNNIIAGYEYKDPQSGLITKYSTSDIIQFKFTSPLDSYYYGYSPMYAIQSIINLGLSINEFEQYLMDNLGVIGGLFRTDQPLKEDEMKNLEEKINEGHTGVTNAGKMLFVSHGVEFQQVAVNPKEMNYLRGREVIMKEVAAAYGVPISKLQTDNVNLANALAGDQQYQRDTIKPRLMRMEEKLNEQLIPLYDENLFVAFDNPVVEDKATEAREIDLMLRNGVITINEVRRKKGLPDVPWGNTPYVPPKMGTTYETNPPEGV